MPIPNLRTSLPISTFLTTLLLAPAAGAQLPALVVTDSTSDTVWLLSDANGNGHFDDAGEVTALYADTAGTLPLSNNVGVASGPDGTAYVTDSTEDCVFAFRDFNGDGDANDDGEHWRWFDGRAGGNASGVLMPAANGLVRQPTTGAWFVACSNSGAVGVDSILRLIDLNGDGDANDTGEASEYWTAPGSPGGDSLPQAVELGLDGNIHFVDSPSSGPNAKGVYRLVDVDGDGDALDANEVAPFFTPAATNTPFYWCLELGADGWFYTADTGNELVWRFRDLNGDGDAHDANESGVWWAIGTASTVWDLAAAPDGAVYASDSAPVSRIIRLFDTNGNGTIDPGESTVVYDETVSPSVIGNGRGIDLVGAPAAGAGFCFGDGSGAACPCGNAGTAGKGCANSIQASGARLETQGVASVANDTLLLVGTRMPDSSALYFQGTTSVGGGLGLAFGDGLRCAGGTIIRLGTRFNVLGASRYPAAGDLPVSVRGLVAPSDVRTYQIWYRNADASFCTSDTFNLSNGVAVTWSN